MLNRLAADGSGIYADGTINEKVPSDLDPGPGQMMLNPANGKGFVTRLNSVTGTHLGQTGGAQSHRHGVDRRSTVCHRGLQWHC